MTNADVERIRRDGFTVLEGVLAPGEIAELTEALSPFEAVKPMGRNGFEGERTQRVYSLAGKGEVFMHLSCHPVILEILDALLLPNCLLSNLQSIRLHPGETAQPWHADDSFYDVRRPREKPLGISVIWALEAFTVDNGATELMVGSHLWGEEHPDDRAHTTRTSVMPAGSALVFDAALWHRGGANRSQGTRLAISPQYCQPWLRPQESQLLIAPPQVAASYSARARAMLGYSIHPPFIGQVDGMHPLRLVDASYRENKTRDAEIADRVLARPSVRMAAGD
jgi:ectoine hydroxylase-related dioxygenase (phytanoyl-CoA dioxygenase family)